MQNIVDSKHLYESAILDFTASKYTHKKYKAVASAAATQNWNWKWVNLRSNSDNLFFKRAGLGYLLLHKCLSGRNVYDVWHCKTLLHCWKLIQQQQQSFGAALRTSETKKSIETTKNPCTLSDKLFSCTMY